MTERVYTAEEISAAVRLIADWSADGAPPLAKAEPAEKKGK